MKPIVYLAGPVLGATRAEANGWRHEAAEACKDIGVLAISPLRAEWLGSERYGFGGEALGGANAIPAKNFYDVSSCDLVFAYMPHREHVSMGSLLEIGWAKSLAKPVVLVTDDAYLSRHPVVRWCCGWVVEDFQEGLTIVADLLHAYAGGKNV